MKMLWSVLHIVLFPFFFMAYIATILPIPIAAYRNEHFESSIWSKPLLCVIMVDRWIYNKGYCK